MQELRELLDAVPPSQPSAPDVAARVAFTGQRSEFRRLVTRGASLELVTLGFYRFWLATDMRRHLWSHSAVDGDAPEYTGTAKELLIGFLIAMAILVPVYVAYTLIGLEAERLQAFASVPLVVFFYLFAQFAIYRARRYRLTRTIWRGVRFWMTGSGWNYAWRAGLWTLFVGLTLGLALPWRQAALERFKMRHSFYGDLPGSFEATGGELFKRGWWLWLLAWLVGWLLIPLPFIYAAYKAMEWRWWVGGIRFGEVRFESDLRNGALIDLYWKVIGWGALLFVLLSIWVGIVFGVAYAVSGVATSSAQEMAAVFQHPAILVGMGLGYVAAALTLGLAVRLYLVRDMWQRVAASALVHNLAAADNVAARGHLAGALGEGLADGLDIGGF